MTTTYILMFLWWITGFCSFVYWWTKDSNFTSSQIIIAGVVGSFGPIAFILLWLLFGDAFTKPWILVKRRK